MLDPEFVRAHRLELSYLTGRFLTEHLIRVHAAFEGDLTAALVLGTIGQHYIQRFYDEYARDSAAGLGSWTAVSTCPACVPATPCPSVRRPAFRARRCGARSDGW